MDKWHIIQTRPRWEKKVADHLGQNGIESYCPTKRVKRNWSDRVKVLEQPLFKSCVLVKISAGQKNDVRLLDGVVNFVYQNGKLVQLKEKEIQMLRKIANVSELEDRMKKAITMENEEQQKSLSYVERFNQWLKGCMERPKLV